MQLPKAFYYTGDLKTPTSIFFFAMAIIGAIVVLFGLWNHSVGPYYVIGAALLAISAFYFKLYYFVALQMIILSGHGAVYFRLGIITQVVLPIFLVFQLLIYYMITDGIFNNIYRFIGIIGVAILALGFTYYNEWLYFFGAVCVLTYALYKALHGCYVAWVWVVLNIFFGATSIFIIFFSDASTWDYPSLIDKESTDVIIIE